MLENPLLFEPNLTGSINYIWQLHLRTVRLLHILSHQLKRPCCEFSCLLHHLLGMRPQLLLLYLAVLSCIRTAIFLAMLVKLLMNRDKADPANCSRCTMVNTATYIRRLAVFVSPRQ